MEKQPHITRAQRTILDFLKSKGEYTSVTDVMKITETTRQTTGEHLATLVRYRCVHKHPGPGRSYNYKWLRDEADLSAPLPSITARKPKPIVAEVAVSEVVEGGLLSLMRAFSEGKWLPSLNGNVSNFPIALAIIYDQVTNIQYGKSVDVDKLYEARQLLIDLHKSIVNLTSTVGSVINTESLFSSEGIVEYFDVTMENYSLEELTSLVDDVRKHNG